MYFSTNKDVLCFHVLFSYPIKQTFVSLSTAVFPLSVTAQNISAVKALGSSSARLRKTTLFLSFSAGKGDTQRIRPLHSPTFQLHLETGTFAKAVPRFCKSPSSLEKAGAALLLGAVTFPLLPVLSQTGTKHSSRGGDPLKGSTQPGQPQPTRGTKGPAQPQRCERHAAKSVSSFRVLI